MPATEHDHRFRAFGTDVGVLAATRATPLDALRVHALFQRLHRALTRFDGGSELSALNARAGEKVAVVGHPAARGRRRRCGRPGSATGSSTRRSCRARARRLRALARRRVARAARRRSSPPPRRRRRRARRARPPRWQDIALDPATAPSGCPRASASTSAAAPRAWPSTSPRACSAAVPTFAVDAGGDIRLGGTRPAPRTVHIAAPAHRRDRAQLRRDQRRRRHQRPAHPPLAHRARLRPPPHRPRPRHARLDRRHPGHRPRTHRARGRDARQDRAAARTARRPRPARPPRRRR